METKKAFITGITGGIGSFIAKALLDRNFEIYAIVRDLKKAEEIFKIDGKNDPRVLLYEGINMVDRKEVKEFLTAMAVTDVCPYLVVLGAGKFEWDSSDKYSSIEEAIHDLDLANYVTAEVFISGLKDVYGKKHLKNTKLVVISSQAANFGTDHPFRKGEEAYVLSKAKASALGRETQKEGFFEEVLIEEPGTIDTPAARKSFSSAQTDWSKAISPEDYVDSLMVKLNLY